MIICNNYGALLVKARANTDLKSLDFYNLDAFLQAKIVQVNPDFALQIQATEFECGGLSITFTFDHAQGDATLSGNSSLHGQRFQEISRFHVYQITGKISSPLPPSLRQNIHKMQRGRDLPKTLIKRLYHINASSINTLQALATVNGESRTKIEAFSAYVWKKMVDSIESSHKTCKMGWLVDGRGRLETVTSSYIGNVLSVAVGEATVENLD